MTEKTKKLYIKTHGCQMNEYDSARIQDLLGVSHNLEPTDNPEEADVLLLNTCSIREKAQEKVFHQLGRWKKLKDKNPDLLIGVGGCVASQEGGDIGQRAPYVDVIFGPQTLHRVPEMIDQRKPDGPVVVDVTFPEIEKFDSLPEPSVDGPSAFVSIMEGCSKYCTFCVVPYTRGEEVSRPFDDVIAEVAQLTENFSITASIGVAGFRPADSIDSLLRRADAALYRAKQNGRNLVVHSRDGDQDPPKGERITRQRASV